MNPTSDARAPEYKEADRDPKPAVPRPVVPGTRARGAVIGHNVRYVLGFGIGGVVIAFIIIYLIYVL